VADETRAPRHGGGARAAVAWLAILGLAAIVVWLVSERNARTWYLVPDDGRLVVMRGILAPIGRQTFKTADPVLAQAYEPIVAPPGKPLPEARGFDERSALDQGLYDLISGWAREGSRAAIPRGSSVASAISPAPSGSRDLCRAARGPLALRAESGYFEAQRLLERAAGELRDAAEKLRHSGGSRSAHANDARAPARRRARARRRRGRAAERGRRAAAAPGARAERADRAAGHAGSAARAGEGGARTLRLARGAEGSRHRDRGRGRTPIAVAASTPKTASARNAAPLRPPASACPPYGGRVRRRQSAQC
jgi:hypothetical protein